MLVAAWLIGVTYAAWQGPGGPWAAGALAALLAAGTSRRRPMPALLLGLVAAGVALLGVWRQQAAAAPPPASDIAHLIDAGPVRLHGIARVEPEERERSRRLRLRVQSVDTGEGWRPATGGVLVRLPLAPPIHAGDVVRLEGRLTAPPELPHFDYRAYLARQGIGATMEYPRARVTGHEPPSRVDRALAAARRRAAWALDEALPQPWAALARGIVVGDRGAIPRALTDDFNVTGVSHLIAISGFNITLVAGMIVGALSWLAGRRPAATIALATITLYAVFVGLSASVARALIMGMLVIGATLTGRPGAPLVTLAVAAAAMTAHDPLILGDLGFQLSFGATAGIMLLAPAAQAGGRRVVAGHGGVPAGAVLVVWDLAAITLAATLATLPVMLHAFGRVSLVSPLANLVLVPVFPVVMITSGLAAATAAIVPASAPLVGAIAWPPLAFTTWTVQLLADMPAASVSPGHLDSTPARVVYGCAAIAGLLAQHRVPRWVELAPAIAAPRFSPAVLAVAVPLALLAALAGGAWLTRDRPDGRLTVTYAEAGGAPIALIRGPGGERVLIDTGTTRTGLARAVDPLLPPRQLRIDMLLLTRRAPATLGGLESAVQRYRPRAVVGPAVQPGERPIDAGGRPFTQIEPGMSVALSRGARIEIAAVAGDAGRLGLVAVMGHRRIAITTESPADVRPIRLTGGAPGRTAVTTTQLPELLYDVRMQGPIQVSTDGSGLRLRVSRGAPLPRTLGTATTPPAWIGHAMVRDSVASVGDVATRAWYTMTRRRTRYPSHGSRSRRCSIPAHPTQTDRAPGQTDGDAGCRR